MVEEDTAKLGAVKEFESQKRICIYIGELNAQSSSLHIDIAASTSPVRKIMRKFDLIVKFEMYFFMDFFRVLMA